MKTTTSNHVASSFRINERKHAICGTTGDVGLTPREYDLLICLADHAGSPVSRIDILHDAWEWDNADQLKTKTVEMHVRRLRKKFEQAGIDPCLIATIRGQGYALIA